MFRLDVQTDGWTDRDRQADTHDEANRHFLYFAFVPKKQVCNNSSESKHHLGYVFPHS
jgi:hypothetical protein